MLEILSEVWGTVLCREITHDYYIFAVLGKNLSELFEGGVTPEKLWEWRRLGNILSTIIVDNKKAKKLLREMEDIQIEQNSPSPIWDSCVKQVHKRQVLKPLPRKYYFGRILYQKIRKSSTPELYYEEIITLGQYSGSSHVVMSSSFMLRPSETEDKFWSSPEGELLPISRKVLEGVIARQGVEVVLKDLSVIERLADVNFFLRD